MIRSRPTIFGAFVLTLATSLSAADNGWSVYGRDAGGTRYSPLKQVTPANVAKLKVAWTYHTGALQPETSPQPESRL